MAHTPHLQPGIKQRGLILNGKIFNRAHRGQELEPNMKEVLQGAPKKNEKSTRVQASSHTWLYKNVIEDEWPAQSYPNKISHRLPYLSFLWMKPSPKRHSRALFLSDRKVILLNSEEPLWRFVPPNILGQYVAA